MNGELATPDSWKTKPTDRFILKWIKRNLSARITPRLLDLPRIKPWMVTLSTAFVASLAGIIFALGVGWLAGLLAAASQVLDGVDGQLARLTGKQSKAGALLDSVIDRYSDGALIFGLILYLAQLPASLALWQVFPLGALALIGSSLVSYSTARSENLDIPTGKPTLCSKGTRTTVIALCGLGSPFWPLLPLVALGYLVLHPNALVLGRLIRAYRAEQGEPEVVAEIVSPVEQPEE